MYKVYNSYIDYPIKTFNNKMLAVMFKKECEERFPDIKYTMEYANPKNKQVTEVEPKSEKVLTLAEVRDEHVLSVLNLCGNNKAKAAKLLDISVKGLYNLLEALNKDKK